MKTKKSEYQKLTKVELIDLLLERDAEIAELKALVSDQNKQVADLLEKFEHLDIEHSYLKNDKFGSKSEAGAPVAVPASDPDVSSSAACGEAEKAEPKRGHGVRSPLPEFLPRNESVDESLCTCPDCGEPLEGEISVRWIEMLQVIPKQFYVDRVGLPTRKCRNCNRPVGTPAPRRIVAKGMLGDRVIANMAVEKYVNHRTNHWYRNEIINAGIPIGNGTVTGSMVKLAKRLLSLYDRMLVAVLDQCRIEADDTVLPMKRMKEDEEVGGGAGKKKGLARGRAWHFYVDPRAYGGDGPRLLYIAASATWSKDTPQQLLKGYEGILQTDAYPGWFVIAAGEDGEGLIVHSLCQVHARRNFTRMRDHWKLKNTGIPAHVRFVDRVLALFAELFAVEDDINGCTPEKRYEVRQERSAPVMDRMREEFERMRPKVAKGTNVAQAINYMLKHWDQFTVFLTDGRITLSTNGVEGMIRPMAKGRNMWMYAGSLEHAQCGAVISTLLQTARLNGLDPEAWLLHVIQRIPPPLTEEEEKDEEKVRQWNEKCDSLLPQNLTHVEEIRTASPCRQPTAEALAALLDPQSASKGDQDSRHMKNDGQDRDLSTAQEQEAEASNADSQPTQGSKAGRKSGGQDRDPNTAQEQEAEASNADSQQKQVSKDRKKSDGQDLDLNTAQEQEAEVSNADSQRTRGSKTRKKSGGQDRDPSTAQEQEAKASNADSQRTQGSKDRKKSDGQDLDPSTAQEQEAEASNADSQPTRGSKTGRKSDGQDRDPSTAKKQEAKASKADSQQKQGSKIHKKGANTDGNEVPIIVEINGLELGNAEVPWKFTRKLKHTRENKLTHANSNTAQKASISLRHEGARSPPMA